MIKVIGVRFKEAGKIYFFNPDDLKMERDSSVIVETVRGIEFGKVVWGVRFVEEDEVVLPLKRVLRLATSEDIQKQQSNQTAAADALQLRLQQIVHGLPYQMFLMLPYVLGILALIALSRSTTSPRALMIPYRAGTR